MKMKRSFIILIVLSVVCSITSAQTKLNNTKLFKRAMHLADEGNYKDAISNLKVILENNPKDLDALFNIGLCYLNTSDGADTAIIFLNRGMNTLTEDQRSGYFGREFGMSIGKAYQVLLKPLKAIEIYEDLLVHVPEEDTLVMKELEYEIQICHNANFFLQHPIDITVENMGPEVNSMYDDHSPLVCVSESELFFTSRRNWMKLSLLPDGQYAEKIYSVPLSAKNWESARLLKVFFKQNEHESAASLSPDGDEMVLFRNDVHGKSLYISQFDGKNWSEPEKLPYPINSFAQETHGSLSADKSTLFFTSDREGGLGGIDIYMAKKNPDGSWGNPKNLGPNINTEYDEETPMIHYDGKTLYFSSEGHNSMGRLDVFYAQMNPDSTWSRPVNLGYPINTPDDDFFFVPTVNKSQAYYASSKFDDNYGGSDIYHVQFDSDDNTELAVVEGQVDELFGDNMKGVRILVTRTKDKLLVGDYRPNPTNGKYMLFLDVGYEYEVRQTNSKEDKNSVGFLNVTSDMDYQEKKKPILFKEVVMDAPLEKMDLVDNVTKEGVDPLKLNTEVNGSDKSLVLEDSNSKKQHLETTSNNEGTRRDRMPETVKIVEQRDENNAGINIKKRYIPSTKKGYTIQLMALEKGPLKNLSFFTKRGIQNVKEVYCIDGFTRYIFGEFDGYKSSLVLKKKLQSEGNFSDIWIRPLRDLEDLKVK